MGQITPDELTRRLTDTDIANGFANRFLFVLARRKRLLPSGGNFDPTPVVKRVHDALTDARRIGRMQRSPEAEERWSEMSRGFGDGEPGLLGAITALPDAQTLRLSVTYALLEGSKTIEIPHLEAAFAVWRFSEGSAAWIFRDAVGDPIADKLLEALRATGEAGEDAGLTLTEQRDLFGGHVSADWLEAARQLLERHDLISTVERKTAGRPIQISAATARTREKPPLLEPMTLFAHANREVPDEIRSARPGPTTVRP
jgi:hypothetical protein